MAFLKALTIAVALISKGTATTLYTTDYDGTVATLSLTRLTNGGYSLTKQSQITACGEQPSWLTYDSQASTLYCSDEYDYPNGSLSSYTPTTSGLTPLASVKTIGGNVASIEYGGSKGNSYIALAHYQASAVSTFALPLTSTSKALQTFIYTLSTPGPNAARQAVPHVHEVVLDPTGNFILAPDLGADLVRIFSINNSTGQLTTCPSHNAPAGSGPRHAAFKILDSGRTVLYLTSELANNVTALNVNYNASCLTLSPFQTIYTSPAGTLPPVGGAVAEVRVLENNVYVSNRNTSSSLVDSFTTYNLSPTNGSLSTAALTSTTGSWPRTLVFNRNGTLAAVGNQDSGEVVVFERELGTGVISTSPVASLVVGTGGSEGNGGLSSVIFAE